MRVRQIFAEDFARAGRGIAREGDAGAAVAADIAKNHRLHDDGDAEILGNFVQRAIGLRARAAPGKESRADRGPKLLARILGKAAFRDLEIERENLTPVRGGKLNVARIALRLLELLQRLLEFVMLMAERHAAEKLDETAVAVIGEALVAASLSQVPRPSDRSGRC